MRLIQSIDIDLLIVNSPPTYPVLAQIYAEIKLYDYRRLMNVKYDGKSFIVSSRKTLFLTLHIKSQSHHMVLYCNVHCICVKS